jgi:hypothetical protein
MTTWADHRANTGRILDPFAKDIFSLDSVSDPSAGRTVSGGGTSTAGTPHTVPATANSGYTFAN